MSTLDKKRDIFNKIGSYSSYMNQPNIKKSNSLSSVNGKNDVISFLLDGLSTIAGNDGLKKTVGEVFTKVIGSSEVKIKNTLKKQVTQFNSGNNLPNDFINNGYNIPIKNIDSKGKIKIDPLSDSGDLLYSKNTSSSIDFDNALYNSVKTPNTVTSPTDMNVDLKYNAFTDTVNIKPSINANNNIGEYLNNYIDNSKLLNSNEITTNVMDNIYGTISKKENKNKTMLIEDMKIQKLLNNVSNNDYSFNLSSDDLIDIDKSVENIYNGVVIYDIGCGLIPSTLSFNDLSNLISNISGSTDVNAVSNAFDNVLNVNDDVIKENKETIRGGFFQKLIKTFTIAIMQAVTTQPQIRVLMIMVNAFQNNGQVATENGSDYLIKMKNFIICLIKEIIGIISEFIFNIVVGYLVSLLAPVVKKVMKEKINQFKKLMTGLTGLNKVSKTIKSASG